jgi:NitT/TauT family transport system substrate-binding protein
MQLSLRTRGLTLGVAAMMLVGACSATPAAPTTGPAATPPPGATPVPATPVPATPVPATPTAAPTFTNQKDFWVGFTSTGLSSAGFLSAIGMLNENGYDIKTPILAQSELVTEGVANGQFAFGSGANNAVLIADQAGANLKVVTDRIKNEWTLYARTATIKTCADLAGKRVAIHSEGAVSTAMVRNYVATNCPGTEPDYVVIEGSPNRVAALLADQIDASPLELGDSITIDTQASDRFSLLSSFANDLPELHPTSIYVNADWAAQNPQSTLDLVKAVITEYRKINTETGYLKTIAEKYVPAAINPDTIDAAVAKYIELKMFPEDGGLTQANLEYTATFFGPKPAGTGATETVIPFGQWADLSYLTQALSELK